MLARILWFLDPLSSQQLKKPPKNNPQSLTPLSKLSGSAHEKINFLRRRNDVHVRTVKTQITLVGGSRNYRQGLGVQDTLTQQLTFLV